MALRSAPAYLFLVLLAATIYLPGVKGGFVFDDYFSIVLNDPLTLTSLSPGALLDAAFSSNSGPFRRPLAMLTFAVNRTLTGLDPIPFKLTNIAIHAANAVLLLIVVRRILPVLTPSCATRAPALAWVIAALWAAHPINLTSVLYVAQRMTSLASTWMLLALLGYVILRIRQIEKQEVLWIWWGAVLGCGICAILTKETALLLPLYIFVVEIVVFRFQATVRLRSIYYGLIAVGAIAGIAMLISAADIVFAGYAGRSFSPVERVLTEARVLMFYLHLICVPDLSNFALFHDDITVSKGLLVPPTTILSIAGLGALAAAAALSGRRYVAFGIAWFLAGHVLESTVYPLELVHEHRNYLPSIGIVLIAVIAVAELLGRVRWGGSRALTAVLAISVFASVTASRASIWADPETQIAFQAAHHPKSARSVYELGRIKLERSALTDDATMRAEGREAMERALDLAAIPTLPLTALLKTAVDEHDDARIAEVIAKLAHVPRESVKMDVFEEFVKCQAYRVCTKAPDAVRDLAHALLGDATLSELGRRHIIEWLAVFYMRVLGDPDAALDMLTDLAAASAASYLTRARLAEALFGAGRMREAAELARQVQQSLPWASVFTERTLRRRLQHIATSMPDDV